MKDVVNEPKKKPLSFAKKVLAKQSSATKTEFNRPKVRHHQDWRKFVD